MHIAQNKQQQRKNIEQPLWLLRKEIKNFIKHFSAKFLRLARASGDTHRTICRPWNLVEIRSFKITVISGRDVQHFDSDKLIYILTWKTDGEVKYFDWFSIFVHTRDGGQNLTILKQWHQLHWATECYPLSKSRCCIVVGCCLKLWDTIRFSAESVRCDISTDPYLSVSSGFMFSFSYLLLAAWCWTSFSGGRPVPCPLLPLA